MKTMLFAAVAAVTMGAGAYAPAKSPLMTEWGEKVTPENAWREYPRPQMVLAHLNELGHAKGHARWTYEDGLFELAGVEKAGGRAVMPLWGDRLV